ncbi:MAG: nitrate reductase associated protein [Proteobacteria bacterium]|nr:nitrate reductase associated protein [Pseudomonadota bacterium]
MNDTTLFAFESDFVATLRCVPMAVRFKLDACGIKLSLRQWSRFTREDRHELLMAPCGTPAEVAAYRERLVALIAERTGQEATLLGAPPEPLWERPDTVAPAVIDFADQIGAQPPSADDWRRLTPLQRFALIKLSRDNHDNVNFVPALREFGLAEAAETV